MNFDLNEFPLIDDEPEGVYDSIDELQILEDDDEPGDYVEVECCSEGDLQNSTDNPLIPEGFDISGSLVGIKSGSWRELYELYKQHSRAVGFSIRKSTTRRIGGVNSLVTEKYFLCSCEGKPKSQKLIQTCTDDNSLAPGEIKKRKRVSSTRTCCQAFLRVKLLFNKRERERRLPGQRRYELVPDVYEVVSHVVAHNHTLTSPRWQHHHRSERQISEEEGALIQVMTDARVPAAVQYRFLSRSCGGDENVGHTQKDHFNFVNRLKMKAIEGGDAQTVIEMLQKRQSEDPDFFFRFKLDSNCRVTHLFWRDSMMKEDYLLYHDVLVFDTTYRTNKYNLICGAFVGINNHWSNVMFGCAFLSDEKSESFEWLFETFNESMGGDVFPISIFTDQDQAMSNAIEKVYPMSKHRLCLWHIQQNAMSHFGSLKHDSTFRHVFNKCLRGCYNEQEFEVTWNKMIVDYNLQNDPWFIRLYAIRTKWCTALSKDFFSAGILSSQRSESTNHAISFNASKTTSLTDFYAIFSETVKRWRREEERNEFQCSRSTPASYFHMGGLLRHASEVYTLNLFREFEKEFGIAMSTQTEICTIESDVYVYKVFFESPTDAAQFVSFDPVNVRIDCSCRYFQEAGLLCCHSIRVLHLHSISTIPENYISKRWTKYAKYEVWKRYEESDTRCTQDKDLKSWRCSMLRKFHNLIMKCQDVKEARALLDEAYTRDLHQVSDLLESLRQNSTDMHLPSNVVVDPPRSKTKGRAKRKKNATEGTKRKKSARASNGVRSDTYVPPPRLI